MTNKGIGRNDQCPCGSGKKFKKCCLQKDSANLSDSSVTEDIFKDLQQNLDDIEFNSIEDARGFAADFMAQKNSTSIAGFQGLSPDQMYKFLHSPFESPELVNFPDEFEDCFDAPAIKLFYIIAEAIGDKGIKATAKGNLPQKLCREAFVIYKEAYAHNDTIGRLSFIKVNKEEDFYELHSLRLIAGLAGLIRKTKGRYVLSSKCKKLLVQNNQSGIYECLLRAFALEFNWAYGDGYQQFDIIQQSFLFTLYMLKLYGEEWQDNTFYEERYIQAFPAILQETYPSANAKAEQEVSGCYTLRTVERFAGFMGLIKIKSKKSDIIFGAGIAIRKTPLLDKAVVFDPGMLKR